MLSENNEIIIYILILKLFYNDKKIKKLRIFDVLKNSETYKI